MASKQQQITRTVPKLVKAADVAAQRAKRELARNPVVKAALRVRAPRDERDARQLFESLFGADQGPAVMP